MKRAKFLKTAILIIALVASFRNGTGINFGNVYEAAGSELASGIGYQKIGAIYHDEYGMMTWYQYAYDENGMLISERCNYYDYGGYTETIYHTSGQKESEVTYDAAGNVTTGMVYAYNENNDLISARSYLESESMLNEEYRYDYDANGKKIIKYKKNSNTSDWVLSSEYFYHADGYLEKEIVHYEWSDACIEEFTYDAAGNVTESTYDDGGMGAGSSYSYNAYDENGTLVTTTFFSLMEGAEVTYQYENAYDAAGNLLSSFNFYPNGAVCSSMENVYANVEAPGQYYSLDDIYACQAAMNGGEVFWQELSSEEIFAQIKESIYHGDTVFTFGYKAPPYMSLNDVSLWETGNDEFGDYMEVCLRYDSSYGVFEFWGKVYYIINGNSVIITKCIDNVAGNAENPNMDLKDLADANETYSYVFYGRYCRLERDETGKMNIMDDGNLHFSSDGVFHYVVNDQVYQRGEYMTAPSDLYIDVHNYDFTLTFCVDGLCKTYYCRTLEERAAMYVCDYDVETGTIISHETWVSESSIGNGDLIERIANAE